EGVPVVVEVKRSSDTRIRREVVGQMLDYAANGVKYWPVTDLRGAVDQAAAEAGKAGEDLVAALRPGLDPEEYWKTVEANLVAGRIRMLFVADKLPPELVHVIEFLNEQMNPAEVLGVELPPVRRQRQHHLCAARRRPHVRGGRQEENRSGTTM